MTSIRYGMRHRLPQRISSISLQLPQQQPHVQVERYAAAVDAAQRGQERRERQALSDQAEHRRKGIRRKVRTAEEERRKKEDVRNAGRGGLTWRDAGDEEAKRHEAEKADCQHDA